MVYFMTGFGHEAVSIFFVISGYLVGGKALALMKKGTFSWKRYLIQRSTRLYAVLLAALVLGALLDLVGSSSFNGAGLYNLGFTGRMAVLPNAAVDSLNVRDFLLNAIFMQTVLGPTFGSNGPLWSLANEWWYYILFPALCLVILGTRRKTKVAAIVTVASLILLLPGQMLALFGVWLVGVAVALLPRRYLSPWGALPIFLLVVAAARLEVMSGYVFWMYAVGLAFGLLLASMADIDRQFCGRRISRTLANFSYSVYLLHFPIIMFLVSVCFTETGRGVRMQFGAESVAWLLLVFSVTIFVSWLVSLFTESKTEQFRAMVLRMSPKTS